MKKTLGVVSIVALFLALTSITFALPMVRIVGSYSEYLTIQSAINASSDGDVVIIPPGLYTGEGNRDIDFNGLAITVTSMNPDDPDVVAYTIIDCQGSEANPRRGFYFHSGEGSDSVLQGVTITNGYISQSGEGGGIYCSNSGPIIQHCVISGNVAGKGGGMYNYGRSGAPTVRNCVFRQNVATRNNHGSDGGGGMANFQNSPILINCVFAGNHAVRSGGAMTNNGSNDDYATLVNCTIVGNTSDHGCGGVAQWISNIRTTFTNCILWENSDSGVIHEGTQISFGSPVINHSCIQGWTGSLGGVGNIGDNPNFVDADGADDVIGTADDDFHVLSGSSCIDAGTTLVWPDLLPAKDFGGNFRQLDGDGDGVVTVDMGVYEYGTAVTPLISAQPDQIGFIAHKNESNVPAQTLFVWNLGVDTLNWQISEDCPWLNAAPSSGASTGEFDEVELTVNVLGLAPGDHHCTLTVSDAQAANSPVTVSIDLRIGGAVRNVPGDYTTIQAAIDASVDDDIITVADGIYTGLGNYDIHFNGKAVTVKSQDGPRNCIIDCQQNGIGFYFRDGEDANSVLDGFTITNGRGSNGGAICCLLSDPTIKNCIMIYNNSTTMGGGGMLNMLSSPTVIGCVFSNNTAYDEFGYGYGAGGGMYNVFSNTTIINCIFVGNSAASDMPWDGEGGGIYNDVSNPSIINSIFWGNTDRNGSGETSQIYSDPGSSPVINYSCVQGWTGAMGGFGNIGADPEFVDAEGGDLRLMSSSLCIDAGDDSVVTVATDLDGNARVMGAAVDMGAYEFVSLAPIEAVAYVFPRVLNTTSRGRYVIAKMELPDGISKDDVASDSLVLIIGDTVIETIRQRGISSGGQDYVFGFFDRGRVIAQAEPEPESEPEAKGKGNGNGNGNGNGKSKLDIVIAGELTTGQCVYGEDSIKIVKSQAPPQKTPRRRPARNSKGGRR